jgi:putative addiction module component (TIGR02574 family)
LVYKSNMSSKAKKLLDEALQLAPREREKLAGKLFDSLAATDPDAERAWQAEIEQRLSDLDSGKVKPVPWAKAKAMIFGDADDSSRN